MSQARYRNPAATWSPSPNYTAGRQGHDLYSEPRYIVIHTMVGWLAATATHFANAGSQVSAHYGVGVNGELTQYVDEGDAAWHAGNFTANLDSIGIEHEDRWPRNADGSLGPEPTRPDALYARSAKLVADICRRMHMPCDGAHVRPHNSFVATGCPDHLDLARIIREANAILSPPPAQPAAPEWKQNLKADPQSYALLKPVQLISFDTGAAVTTIAGPTLATAYVTSVHGSVFRMTQYAVDHGAANGVPEAQIQAAIATPPAVVDPCADLKTQLVAAQQQAAGLQKQLSDRDAKAILARAKAQELEALL